VASLVEDVIMPLIGALIGGINFTVLAITVGSATLKYGKFLQACLDFLIIAAAIFLVVKLINRLKREEAAAPPAPPRQEVLLEEIRDLLKAR
jgi:large conductance mechanosensitive channel